MSAGQSERVSVCCADSCGYDSCDDEKEIMERNWKKNMSEIEKVAFREGATCSENESDVMFQMGFDNGYKDGFKNGYQSASYKSTIIIVQKHRILKFSAETWNTNIDLQNSFIAENVARDPKLLNYLEAEQGIIIWEHFRNTFQ